MKRFFLFLFLILITSGIVFSQTESKKQRGKKGSQTVQDSIQKSGNNDEVSSFSNISEGQEDEDNGNSNFVPGLLHSSQDVYTNNTSYTFSIAYFRTRGYDNRYQDICINGFLMNSLITGRATYSQWGGLNHIVRYPEVVTGLNAAAFTFGDIGGATNYNLRASAYRKQVRVSYSLTNRTYTNRIMATAATGIMKNGWSFAGSVSTRFGNSLSYVDGTSYDGYSYFVSAEKLFNQEHSLTLTAFGAPTVRGMQSNSVNEVYQLLDDNYYNPNWGWYNGEKRNARVRSTHEPAIMLSHYYTPKNNRMVINSTLATTFGRNSTTSLNWYDVPDPRPDYYRYLPSYQIQDGDTTSLYYDYQNAWLTDASYRQVNWDKLYSINQLAASQGLRGQYMVENRVIDHIQVGGASHLVTNLNDNIKLSAGIDIRGIRQNNYKTINDLLGGLYWLDVDKYVEGEFPDDYNVQYNDLNHKDEKLYEGDIFGYNYDFNIYIQKLWAMFDFTYNKIDFHVGADIGGTEFWRVGHMKNGRFPNESEGKSDVKQFFEYGAKGGITYKITGRNYLLLNGLYEASAPSVLNSFVAPRIRNKYVDNLTNEKIASADFSYIMNYPVIKMRFTAYFTQFKDITKLISFYHDDLSSMVNYSMSGIDQRHIGIELGTEVKLGAMFSLILAGNWGDYRYSDQAHVTINAENGIDFEGAVSQTVYWKNFHVAGTPQVAGTIGLKFNHNYWWVNINANYFDKIYCDLNPERRTSAVRGTLDANSELYHQIVDQTRLKGQFTLDASISKSWKIKRYLIGFNLSVTNILNNTNLVTTAWEQYRFDYKEYNVNKYQNKYYYAFGTTFYAGINFTFN